MGLSPTLVNLLLDLNLRFLDGRLFIAERFRNDKRRFGLVRAALLGVFKFRTWSDSRWVVLGGASRAYVASLLVGIRSLVEYVRTITPVIEN